MLIVFHLYSFIMNKRLAGKEIPQEYHLFLIYQFYKRNKNKLHVNYTIKLEKTLKKKIKSIRGLGIN